ncbi:MAG: GMP synthase (glutamine-hydrolyzing) [Halovenus sp.]|jgi:GMP synthase (glutamine-hydrolysing)
MSETVLVVDASVGETPAERNLTREIDAETPVYKPPAGELPPPVAGGQCFDGVVVSGSQTAVYEDRDWIHRLTAWVRDVHAADIPVLGICWGHQLLAQALGGRVVAMDEHELGYRTVERAAEDALFAGIPASFTAFQTHSDRVAELPPGARELATNDYGTQAFRLDSSYGVQFHPEYDLETAEWVLEKKSLSAETRHAVEAGLTEENATAARDVARVFDSLLTLVGEHSRRPERQV